MTHSLFQPYTLGSLALTNRIVMAPMTRCRAIENVPNALMAEYYGQRASAGLIISEGVAPSPNGLGYARIPGLFSDAQVAAWRQVTDAVHAKGGKIFAQLMHTGRIGHPANMPAGAELLAPSAVAAAGTMWTDSDGMQAHPAPRAMTLQDIENAQSEFVQAAANAVAAGFDGVELHSANGYLLEQFINPTVNQRTDEYGGSVEKRARFLLEVAEKVCAQIGSERVGVRVSPHSTFNDMGSYDEIEAQYVYIASALSRLKIAYLHTLRGPHVAKSTLEAVRGAFEGPFMLNGGYNGEQACDDIDAKRADLISFGSAFISNPDLVQRLQSGAELAAANPDLFYTPGADGYTDYVADAT